MARNRKQQAAAVAGDSAALTPPDADLAADLSSMLAACNARLLDLHREAVAVMFDEAARAQSSWLTALTAMAAVLPQQADRANTMRTFEIAGAWLQIVGQTQASLMQLLARTMSTTRTPAMPRPAGTWAGVTERRRMAVVINFPDRRHIA